MDQVSKYVSHPVTIAVFSAFATLYISTIGPELPDYVKHLFDNAAFRVAVIFLVAYMASARKPVVAVTAAIAFMLITGWLSEHKVAEHFAQREAFIVQQHHLAQQHQQRQQRQQ